MMHLGYGFGKEYIIAVCGYGGEYVVDVSTWGGKRIERRFHHSKQEVIDTYSEYFDLSEVNFSV